MGEVAAIRAGAMEEGKRAARLRPAALSLLCLPGFLALSPMQAAAQTATIGPEATARGVTVMTRPRPDFDPAGVRLGGFRIDSSLELGMGYDDNLQPGRESEKGDSFFTETLNVSANSFWTRHALGLTASQATRQHINESGLNWNDYAVSANGRYDIGRASSVFGSYNYQRAHLDVDNFDVQESSLGRPVPYDQHIFEVGGVAAFNRLALKPSAEYRIIRYEDRTSGGFREVNSSNDYNSLQGELEADYSIVEGRHLLGLVRVQDIRYEQREQRGRDSFTWEAQAGFQYDFTGLWQTRFTAGYRERNYDDQTLKNLSGLAFEGQLIMVPSQLTTVTFALQRTIEESIRASNVSYTRTLGRVTVDHEFLRNVILTGELRAEHRDYPERGTVTDGIALVGAQYLINRNMAVLASYQHTERLDAPEGVREYGINQFQVRLRFSL